MREGCDRLVSINEAHVAARAGGAMQANIQVDDLKVVVDARATRAALFAATFNVGEIDAVALDQEAGAAVGERIDQRRRACGRIG